MLLFVRFERREELVEVECLGLNVEMCRIDKRGAVEQTKPKCKNLAFFKIESHRAFAVSLRKLLIANAFQLLWRVTTLCFFSEEQTLEIAEMRVSW